MWLTRVEGRILYIDSFIVDAEKKTSSSLPEISNHIVCFYQSLYMEQFNWRTKMDELSFNSLYDTKAIILVRLQEESGVLEVVKALNGGKPWPQMVTSLHYSKLDGM